MSRTTRLLIIAIMLGAGPASVHAQWRCDCTTVVDSCSAQVTAHQNWIDVTTDSQQCARVDYFVDGLPFVTTVVEGQHRLDWMTPRANPNILIQSCQVCADNALAGAGVNDQRASGDTDGPLEPLIRWNAAYPEQAQLRGIEGFATVEFEVTPEGGVANASVVDSEPGDLFDSAALDAVRRWRYPADPERAATKLSERIEFSLADMIWQLQPSRAASAAASATGEPRNQCIREDASYNFGEMVEAALINVCGEPLLVYGCAEGIGRQAGRWVCSDTEGSGDMLVRSGDSRIGSTVQRGEAADSLEWLTFADSFFVARAPNSQYWWIACAPSDDACRGDARMWVRSMDRQSSSVDPRGRASITVARSY